MELSIFNFVVVHNRKIPSGLTEILEVDSYLSRLYKMINRRREVDNENDENFSTCLLLAVLLARGLTGETAFSLFYMVCRLFISVPCTSHNRP